LPVAVFDGQRLDLPIGRMTLRPTLPQAIDPRNNDARGIGFALYFRYGVIQERGGSASAANGPPEWFCQIPLRRDPVLRIRGLRWIALALATL